MSAYFRPSIAIEVRDSASTIRSLTRNSTYRTGNYNPIIVLFRFLLHKFVGPYVLLIYLIDNILNNSIVRGWREFSEWDLPRIQLLPNSWQAILYPLF